MSSTSKTSRSSSACPSPIPIRSRSKSTASTSSWSIAISGCARRASRPSCASAPRSCAQPQEYFDSQRIYPHRSADPHAGRLRRHLNPLPGRLLRRSRVPHPVRPALHRVHRACARQGLQLRPHLPRREIEDPPPSDRVLDDRARSRLLRSRRPDGARRKLHLAHRAERVEESRPRIASHRPRSGKAQDHPAAIPAPALRRSREDAQRGAQEGRTGAAVRVRQRLRLARRNLAQLAIRSPRHGASLSGRGQGLLHGARPEGRELRALRRRARARRLRRSHRRLAARLQLRTAQEPHRTRTSCRSKPSSGISIYAATVRVPHAGFGMGIERLVAWICALDHVRETIPFARTLHRIYP